MSWSLGPPASNQLTHIHPQCFGRRLLSAEPVVFPATQTKTTPGVRHDVGGATLSSRSEALEPRGGPPCSDRSPTLQPLGAWCPKQDHEVTRALQPTTGSLSVLSATVFTGTWTAASGSRSCRRDLVVFGDRQVQVTPVQPTKQLAWSRPQISAPTTAASSGCPSSATSNAPPCRTASERAQQQFRMTCSWRSTRTVPR